MPSNYWRSSGELQVLTGKLNMALFQKMPHVFRDILCNDPWVYDDEYGMEQILGASILLWYVIYRAIQF